MHVSDCGLKLTNERLVRLESASETLAALADVIRRANPAWAPGAMRLIIQANDAITDTVAHGLGYKLRFLQRHGGEVPRDLVALFDKYFPAPASAPEKPEAP